MVFRVTPRPASRHRKFNNALSLLVVAYAMYLIVLPAVPYVELWWAGFRDDTGGLVYESRLVSEDAAASGDVGASSKPERAPIPQDNRLVLPTIHLDEELVEGTAASTVHRGAWRKPNSSTPDKGGNTVIVGHRFTYGDPAVFYHLDKIELGDVFPLYWEGQEYNYRVTDIDVVNPDALYVEDPTDDPRLTIYTCTPIWTSSQRLVLVAELVAAPEGSDLLTGDLL